MPPDLDLPPVIGHRGAAASAPENTLAGLRRARALGCGWVEFDVRLTADRQPVVCHDARLDRTSDRCGRIAALDLAAIRSADAGGWFAAEFAGEKMPTLGGALACCIELGLGANIEIKAERGLAAATAAAVTGALRDRKLPPLLISSFLQGALAAAQSLAPDIPRGVLFRTVPRNAAAVARRLGCRTVHADERGLSAACVAALRAAGFPVLAYTVNDPARARILFEWGITSVFSDAPDIILAAAAPGAMRPAAAG